MNISANSFLIAKSFWKFPNNLFKSSLSSTCLMALEQYAYCFEGKINFGSHVGEERTSKPQNNHSDSVYARIELIKSSRKPDETLTGWSPLLLALECRVIMWVGQHKATRGRVKRKKSSITLVLVMRMTVHRNGRQKVTFKTCPRHLFEILISCRIFVSKKCHLTGKSMWDQPSSFASFFHMSVFLWLIFPPLGGYCMIKSVSLCVVVWSEN